MPTWDPTQPPRQRPEGLADETCKAGPHVLPQQSLSGEDEGKSAFDHPPLTGPRQSRYESERGPGSHVTASDQKSQVTDHGDALRGAELFESGAEEAE